MKGDEATGQVITFMVAGAIFFAAVGAVLLATRNSGTDRAAPDAARQGVQSGSLASLLVASPGVAWASGADHITRLGLGATNGSGLQQSSVDALRGAFADSRTDGKVDYADARSSLGLAGSQQFHLRLYPVGMDALYNASLSGMRTAYVGDWNGLLGATLPTGTPSTQYALVANQLLNVTMASQTANERNALDSLGLKFNNRVYIIGGIPTVVLHQTFPLPDLPITSLLDGDVYPDQKQYIDANLPGRLAQYDLLVVGAGVDQSTLTSSPVKNGIRDWVLAGGTLVVLGSSAQNYQWLQPLFDLGVATVNGAPSAPDVSHPLLKEPNELAWPSYDTHGLAWDIKSTGSGAHYDDFSHVVVQGGEDVLAISKEGAFGSGRILLTSYVPREFAATLGQKEAEHFFENVVLFADRTNLYLEYGATMPGDLPVSVAVRDSWLWDPVLGQVPIRVEVHTWG
jgi:hypothetical protein